MNDAIGNELELDDLILVISVGQGSCDVHKCKIMQFTNTRIYYMFKQSDGSYRASSWNHRKNKLDWTSPARVIKYNHEEQDESENRSDRTMFTEA